MMEDTEKLEQWMYDFAWRLRDIAQTGNDVLDAKARTVVNFSGALIPIITGFFFFSINSINIPKFSYVLLGLALLALILAIFFAFKTMWLSDTKIIDTHAHFNDCDTDDIMEIKFKTAKTIASWQEKLTDVNEKKSNSLTCSSYSFIVGLILISCSALYIFTKIYYN